MHGFGKGIEKRQEAPGKSKRLRRLQHHIVHFNPCRAAYIAQKTLFQARQLPALRIRHHQHTFTHRYPGFPIQNGGILNFSGFIVKSTGLF